jgi:hypothetical protein
MHINTSLFTPVVDEQDNFNCYSRQVDDINSVIEYINEVILGNLDDTPEDEDDDQAHYYQVLKFDYYFKSQHEGFNALTFSILTNTPFFPLKERFVPHFLPEVISPPPDLV